MTYFNVKSPAEIEAFEARYGDGCHGVKKHKPGTLKLLKDFDGRAAAEFDSRQAGNPKGPNDLWVDLYEHNKDKKSGVTGKLLRKHLRDFLEEEQAHKCCYCQRPLVNISNAKPIEHILPRQPFVQHSFHLWNLAVACFDCNHAKSNDCWIDPALSAVAAYPKPQDFIGCYHPRFHTYDEHIKFVRVQTNTVNISLYIGRTEQGQNLCKKLLKTVSAKDILLSSNLHLKQSLQKLHYHMPSLNGRAAIAVDEFNEALAGITLKLIR
ncbi:HNH endonuclease [Pseudomonas fluorescens]|uniref:HNH nuclease domain-containing protein n=3 Tax=Pseudomonas fluorescens group TaxID=136843 RepID=A0A8B4I8M3_PSEFL|nr:HNH endonuclease domain-containing protein [Pseudomonas fluorescens]MCI4606695.1 hypothetical protein [Pseudomonas fluorescens]PQA97939.1 hypothetical protein B0A76_24190 [Pseudomonas fluorescens]RFP97419.1 hypothetical protein D0N73_04035 [Pseudomonas fluorescens]TWR46144.1 hypothetical protein FIP59_17250 [Pseudomonas fluorescens]UKJ66206.1 hypothetical protein H1Q68_14670 [Pseudomonas fluorescens]